MKNLESYISTTNINSGIGPSTARTILSSISPKEIQDAVWSEDVERIKSIKGIGLKTAQRLIIELKDKVELFDKKDLDLSGEIMT